METIASPAISADENSVQLRQKLHHMVEETDDSAVLQAVLTILMAVRHTESGRDEALLFHQLDPDLRASIEAGLADSAAGRTRTHADVWPELKAKFGVV